MRVGMVVDSLTISGGYQKLVIRLSEELERLRHEVLVYTVEIDRDRCYPTTIGGIRVVTPSRQSQRRGNDRALGMLLGRDLDAVVVHDEFSVRALGFASLRKDCAVVWMLNCELSNQAGSYARRVWHGLMRRRRLSRLAIDFYRAVVDELLFERGLRKVRLCLTYDKRNRGIVRQRLAKPAVVVAAGADVDSFVDAAREDRASDPDRVALLSVGVLYAYRRYEDLIQAVSILRDHGISATATIVGRAEHARGYLSRLVRLSQDTGVSQYVRFVEFATEEELLEQYSKADVFVFVNDGLTWGISVFEAIAAKLPVVITDNIGAADIVARGRYGEVVPPRSPSAIAGACIDIVTNQSRTAEMVGNAFDDLREFVSWNAYAKRVLGAVSRVREGRSRNGGAAQIASAALREG